MRSLAIFALLGGLLFAIDRGGQEFAPRDEGSVRSRSFEATPDGDVRLLAAAAREAGLDRGDPVIVARLVRNLRFLGHDGSDGALYREALALGMDRSDVVIERRLADRMTARLRAAALRDPPDEPELRRWFERHRERWRRPPAVAFTHVFVSRERHGAETRERARVLLAALRAEATGPDDAPSRGDPFLLGARVPLRSVPVLARQLGHDFAEALAECTPRRWSGPVESSYGSHLVWIHDRRAGSLPRFEEVRARVEDAWREAIGDEAVQNAVTGLRGGGA